MSKPPPRKGRGPISVSGGNYLAEEPFTILPVLQAKALSRLNSLPHDSFMHFQTFVPRPVDVTLIDPHRGHSILLSFYMV